MATVEERYEMVTIVLEPGGLYYDLENKIIAALKPRPAFLPVLRMLNGIVEFDETRGLLVTDHWCERNRRASDDLQDAQGDRQTRSASSSPVHGCFLILYRFSSTDDPGSHRRSSRSEGSLSSHVISILLWERQQTTHEDSRNADQHRYYTQAARTW